MYRPSEIGAPVDFSCGNPVYSLCIYRYRGRLEHWEQSYSAAAVYMRGSITRLHNTNEKRAAILKFDLLLTPPPTHSRKKCCYVLLEILLSSYPTILPPSYPPILLTLQQEQPLRTLFVFAPHKLEVFVQFEPLPETITFVQFGN
jgi:hypothetical protein